MSEMAGRPVRHRLLRRVLASLSTVLVVAALAIWAVTLRPVSLKGPAQYVVIHGNSMQPTYHESDLVITRAQSSYNVGDVVAYHVPAGEVGAGQTVIHRITGGNAVDGYLMKGDNNPSPDPWHPRQGDVVGSTWAQIPQAGRVLVIVHQPIVPAAVAMTVTILILWRRPDRPETAPSSAEPTGLATAET